MSNKIVQIHLHQDQKEKRASFWRADNQRVQVYRDLTDKQYYALMCWCDNHKKRKIPFLEYANFKAYSYMF